MDPTFQWLHATGEVLTEVTWHQQGLIVNVNKTHWVAVVLDFQNHLILYGDSLQPTPDKEVVAMMTWWTHHHTGHAFSLKDLPISFQQDSYSCGLLAWNTLVVYFLPGKYLLIDPATIDDERLKVMLWVIQRHQDQVSGHWSLVLLGWHHRAHYLGQQAGDLSLHLEKVTAQLAMRVQVPNRLTIQALFAINTSQITIIVLSLPFMTWMEAGNCSLNHQSQRSYCHHHQSMHPSIYTVTAWWTHHQ